MDNKTTRLKTGLVKLGRMADPKSPFATPTCWLAAEVERITGLADPLMPMDDIRRLVRIEKRMDDVRSRTTHRDLKGFCLGHMDRWQ